MKKITVLMMLYGWSHNSFAQSQASLEQYYYMENKTVSFILVAWYQANNGWYAEGRYNYEAEKTLSMYAGKTFEKSSIFSCSVSPMFGIVLGEFNGGSLALNTDLDYKKFYCSLQSQYTFSTEKRGVNFFYNWLDIGYRPSEHLSAGLSLQQTNGCGAISERGIFMKVQMGAWELPLYIFNPEKSERYTVLGLNFIWERKKKTGTAAKNNNK